MHGLGHIRRAENPPRRCAGATIFRRKGDSPRAAECRASANGHRFQAKIQETRPAISTGSQRSENIQLRNDIRRQLPGIHFPRLGQRHQALLW